MNKMDFTKDIEELKKEFTPAKTAKFVAGSLISLGATSAVIALFKNPLQGAKGITKILMKVGIFVLACKAGDVAEQYFNEQIDQMEDAVKEAQEEVMDDINASATA